MVALAPHDGQDVWYLYDYFDGMREADSRALSHHVLDPGLDGGGGLTDIGSRSWRASRGRRGAPPSSTIPS